MTKLIERGVALGALAGLLFAPGRAWAQAAAAAAPAIVAKPAADTGDTAWMLVSTVLVLAMILPGLALFYGGLTRTKNMLSTMTQIGGAACLAMLVWAMWGYTMTFGEGGNALVGGFGKPFLAGVRADALSGTIPEYVFASFQMTFAAITVALVLGGTVERISFAAVMVFTIVWLTIVYFPIAHMVWAAGGLFFELGALDFAGGTVVHVNAGVSALVAAILIGRRAGYPTERMAPHSLTLTFVGTGLLWVGWFGFNAGSALGANGAAGLAMVNTFLATASAALAWMLTERAAGHKASALGYCSGVIAGLVAVTPAAGNVGPFGAIVLGALASAVCFAFVTIVKPRLGYDDSLDAFGIHGVGGIVGAIGTGVLYYPQFGGTGDGSTPMAAQVLIQLYAVGATIVWAAVGTTVAIVAAKALTGGRVPREVEHEGLDLGEHGERAYNP